MELILTHGNTEFDGFAAQLAAAKLFSGALPVLSQTLNRNVDDFFSLYRPELPFVHVESLPEERITRIILVDTQKLPHIKPVVRHGQEARLEIIDHHPLSIELGSDTSFAGDTVGATTTLLLERLIAEGFLPSRVEATLFLLGIYEDTGSLTYAGTTARDARCVAWLLENGASLQVAGQFLNRPLLPEQWAVYAELTERAEMVDVEGHKVLIAMARPRSHVEELSVLAHKLKDLYDPDALFMLVRLDHHVEMIARSATDAIDVGDILQEFGGGGHGRAAAAVVRQGDLPEIRERLLALLPGSLKPAITAADIMSRHVQVLSPVNTLAEAQEALSTGGHSEMPVVDDSGVLVGLALGEELGRAARRRPSDQVSSVMRRQVHTVSPRSSFHQIQRLMLDFDLAHLPVVDGGKLAGMISKSDLLKVWPGVPGRDRPEADLVRRIEMALPREAMSLVWRASDLAEAMGAQMYLVGGFVRDLLMGIPNFDLDIVVEGDAIGLAKRLGQEFGVEVKSHRQFGTAKLVLNTDPAFRARAHSDKVEAYPLDGTGGLMKPGSTTLRIDFVTARREFYEQSSALPVVEASSIMHDLYRRDFTINTMAVCVDRTRRGKLIDFFGGRRDLDRRLVRVLHNRSFIEDPTRILRAVRLEQRLDFKIETQTLRLMSEVIEDDLLSKVAGQRLRTELYLIFLETSASSSLGRLADLGVLESICSGLRWDAEMEAKARTIGGRFEPEDRPLAYLAFLAYMAGAEGASCLAQRLRLAPRDAAVVGDSVEIRRLAEDLDRADLPASEVYFLLAERSLLALSVAAVVEERGMARRNLDWYLDELRFVEPELDGMFLRRLGVRPGPVYRRLLDRLRRAKLDGLVSGPADEEAFLRAELEKEHGT